jgi:hypothetical protein
MGMTDAMPDDTPRLTRRYPRLATGLSCAVIVALLALATALATARGQAFMGIGRGTPTTSAPTTPSPSTSGAPPPGSPTTAQFKSALNGSLLAGMLAALVGVTLYFLSSLKRHDVDFAPGYLPDYWFRAAQAVTYTFLVFTIPLMRDQTFYDWPPVTVGLFVGLFIQQVEHALEAVAERVTSGLAAFVPRRKDEVRQQLSTRADEIDKEIAELRGDADAAPSEIAAVQERLDVARNQLRAGREHHAQELIDDLGPRMARGRAALAERRSNRAARQALEGIEHQRVLAAAVERAGAVGSSSVPVTSGATS